MTEPVEPSPPPELASASPGGEPAPATARSLVAIILGVAATVVLGLVASVLALGYYSSRRFTRLSREAEGKLIVGELARGIETCSGRAMPNNGNSEAAGLPPSAPPVPLLLADVAGKAGYVSVPTDWTQPTYACAGFSREFAQHYQVEWVRTSPTTGVAHARSDYDGDGKADVTFELDVRCAVTPGSADSCTRGSTPREWHRE